MKKKIDIADQPTLSLGRTIRITVDGIRYRLFRCSVTVAVIAVAVAFLMNIMSESLIKRSVAEDTRERIDQSRLVHEWMARLTAPGSFESILTEVAAASPGTPVYEETAQMTGLSAGDMTAFHADVRAAAAYMRFFETLDYARRRSLVHTAVGVGVFDRLRAQDGMRQFTENIRTMKSLRFITSQEDLVAFLGRWKDLEVRLRQVQEGRAKGIAKVTEARAGHPIMESLAGATGAFGEAVRLAGFRFDAQALAPEVAAQAKRLLEIRLLEKTMEHRPTRQAIAQDFNVLPADVNVMMMWKYLRSEKNAAVYLERMKESEMDVAGLDAKRLAWLAETRREEKALIRAELLTADAGGGIMGMGERMSWLLLVSMLVCGIGISNAMLMTVTERFQEIATLKCLGALDGFIMLMFVLESCFLGVVGGSIGAVLGNVIGTGRMLYAFGVRFVGTVPFLELVFGMVVAVVLGVILAALAAVYPAFKAARLAPMEAMRIE
ncbi:MAG: hypothetical protein A3K19_02305 [Lentisphaerae bacterium RIFOXYB12_FULL_65_16]|nr:MAG: hypothetical protein A3K18_29775 [Lentisphaerae bacterium RIFOXYA12_64_32]OGV86739.1 MAG: hypothetical protein A3K19_02305 [Lentisphaerae bacterium RIFOXYB12_FULL_65_16]